MENLIYFLVWAALIFLMLRFGCGAHVMGHGRETSDRTGSVGGEFDNLRWVPPESDTDPVCGTTVRTDKAKPTIHDGMVFYFCSRECREMFEAAPDLYLKPSTENAVNRQVHAHV